MKIVEFGKKMTFHSIQKVLTLDSNVERKIFRKLSFRLEEFLECVLLSFACLSFVFPNADDGNDKPFNHDEVVRECLSI